MLELAFGYLFADGVGVLAVKARQVAVDGHGEAAAQCLCERDKGALGDGDGGAGGHQPGFHIPLGYDNFPILHSLFRLPQFTAKLSPQPHSAVALGLRNSNMLLMP